MDVVTSAEAGLLSVNDTQVLAHSYSAGRVLVTHDSDFLRLHGQGHVHAGIAYSEQGAPGIGRLVASLVLIYEVLEPSDMVGRIEHL